MKNTHLMLAGGVRTPFKTGGVRSTVLRYVLAAASFALVLSLDFLINRTFKLKLDPTFLIISIMIASAWYLGRGPGLLVAVAFELAIDYFTRPPLAFGSGVVIFNRTLLFASVVWFASSRRGAERRLRQQREWLRVTLSSIGDAVIATDVNGSINFINPAAEALTGWNTAQAADKPLTDVFRILGEGAREPATSPLSIIKREQDAAGFANDTVLVTKDGGEVPIEESAAPIRDADGNAVGVIIVFRDVSERRRAEQEREQLLQRERQARGAAETSDRLKDEFLATVSHELRTPLTAILGWSSILNQYGAHNEQELRNGLGSIERNAKAQAQIVGDILDVSRVITGKLHIDARPFALAPVIQAAVDTMRPAAAAKAISLSTTLNANAGLVTGDPARMQQIVWNLVSNAIKFTPENGRVDVRLGRAGQHVEVSVKDNGIGISKQFLPYVFERFRQADSSKTRTYGGLGLGLAIVRHLVELHGGTVTAESDGEGHGALFTVRLPRAAGADLGSGIPAHELDGAQEPCLVATSAPDLNGLRVLVVDDEADTLEVLRASLGQYGATVQTATSSADALATLHRWKPDVLVSDLGMPVEDGFALIGRVRALATEQGGDVPAIALTAYVREEDRARALDAGFQAHVSKPVDPRTLASMVAELAHRLETRTPV